MNRWPPLPHIGVNQWRPLPHIGVNRWKSHWKFAEGSTRSGHLSPGWIYSTQINQPRYTQYIWIYLFLALNFPNFLICASDLCLHFYALLISPPYDDNNIPYDESHFLNLPTDIARITGKKQGRAVFKALWQGISSRIKHKTKLMWKCQTVLYQLLSWLSRNVQPQGTFLFLLAPMHPIPEDHCTVLHPAISWILKIPVFVRIKQANWESFAPFCVLQLYLCSYSNHNGPILHEKHPVLLLLHRHHLPFSALSRLFNGKLCQV